MEDNTATQASIYLTDINRAGLNTVQDNKWQVQTSTNNFRWWCRQQRLVLLQWKCRNQNNGSTEQSDPIDNNDIVM